MAIKYTYKGTKITGTSTSEKVFKKSGIKKAKKGDTYLNSAEGHVYKCTKEGDATKAKWKYTSTIIVKKPNVGPSNLKAPTRDGYKMKATWKTPSAWIDPKNGRRVTDLEIDWYLGISGTDPKLVKKTTNEKATESSINLNNVKIGKKTYTRESFYPVTKKKLSYVTCKVIAVNTIDKGTSAKEKREFKIPRKPSISAFSFNTGTGRVSCTITTNAGTDYQERYDTQYEVVITHYNYATKKSKTWTSSKGTSKSTSFEAGWDATNYQALNYNDYYKVTVNAWARGFAGKSGKVTKTYYVSYPKTPEIRSTSVSSKDSTGKFTAVIVTNSKDPYPVDEVKLEKLVNVDYSKASSIPADANWEETGAVDNGNCTALTCSVGDLMPSAGKYSWVRVKSWHANEDVLKRYSSYKSVTQLQTTAPTAADDEISIVDVVAAGDGETLIVYLGWDKDGQDDSTGTELTWSDEADAWRSTEAPRNYEFTWSDGDEYGYGPTEDTSIELGKTYYTRTGVGTDADPFVYTAVATPVEQDLPTYFEKMYQNSAKVSIKGLSEGVKYYVRARRYLEGDTVTYSPYSNQKNAITSERPDSITAVCDRYIPKGKSLDVRWVFSSTALQKEWQIVTTSGTVIANGEGSIGTAQISSERLLELATDNVVTFTVQASTGSGFVISEEHSVEVISAPELTISATTPLTVQPFEFTAVATALSRLIVICTSQGAQGQFPEGMLRQTDGDTIYSDVISPTWWPTTAVMTLTSDVAINASKTYYVIDEIGAYRIGGERYSAVASPVVEDIGAYYEMTAPNDDGTFTTIVTFPTGLDFWDLGEYTLSVVAVDDTTGLKSQEQIFNFAIAWEHQAPSLLPTETYTATSDTEVVADKAYFAYDAQTETYSAVIPEGDENPSQEGWFEQSVVNYVTLTPIDEVTDDGYHRQAVQIDLAPPPNSSETDFYDIYRYTGDGARLIGQSFPLTYTAIDEYAPFGEGMTQHYRIAIRTADGDVAFNDFEYVLESETIRFDWQEGSLELPYGLQIGDSYSKDVNFRRHMDGGIDGYWNKNVERKGKLNSSVINLVQQTDIDSARQLARYAGAVFVRTTDGSAYEADVQVTDLSVKNPAVHAVAFDATEIDLTEEFMLPTPYILEETQENE